MVGLVGKSQAILDLERVAQAAAQTASPVLISGESGVGKALFARRLHLSSPRRDKRFVEVNCALLQNPLDGLEAAQDGTLFLNELSAMRPEAQKALLEAVQEKKTAGVRFVCSTSADLELMVKEGKFLEPLFHRLNVVAVRIPPLRERKDDIMPLAEFFLKKFSAETKKNFTGFSDDAEAFLLAARWPGNARELGNAIERACIFGWPPLVGAQDLQAAEARSEASESSPAAGYVPKSGLSLKDAMNGFKKYYVERALRTVGGNQADVAASLGIQRTYLSRLLVELGIRQ